MNLGFTGFYQVLLGLLACHGFRTIDIICDKGLPPILLGYTGFYWVWLGLSEL